MPMYEYEAKSLQGKVLKGTMEAVDEMAVVSALRQTDYYPVRIKLYKEALNINMDTFIRVKVKDIAIFCRQFAVIISAGISILKGLEIVQEQTENRKLKKIIGDIFEEVQRGKTLSESMKKFDRDIPDMLINMVAVGEASGTLDSVMERMAVYYDKEHRLRQKIRQAMTYPIVVSVFSLGVVIMLVVKVVPTFASMLAQSGAELPLPTRIILGLSNVLQNNTLLIIGTLAAIIIGFKFYFGSDRGRRVYDSIKLNVPLFGKIYKKIVTARFARTFGNLMGSGLPLLESINICSEVVGNAVIKDVLDSTKDDIRKGISVGETLIDKDIFPPMLTQMIKIGEETGTLDSILEKTAEFYDTEVETATGQMTTLIEPIMIIFLAVVVGFIVLSIVLPIFQMYNTVG